jgi:F-type H+-transporting ATP synthase subunit e
LRWSALFAGVTYGIYHQSALRTQQKTNEAKRKYHEQENLITKAKAEYLKKTMPNDKTTAGGDGTCALHFQPRDEPSREDIGWA